MNTLLTSAALCATLATGALAAGDIPIADFEGDSYAPWTVTGEAFGPGPAKGTLPGQMRVDGFKGERLVNSFFNGDNTTGTLTSPEFRIERKFIAFLVGGGRTRRSSRCNCWWTARSSTARPGRTIVPAAPKRSHRSRGMCPASRGRRPCCASWTTQRAVGGTSTWTTDSKPKGFVKNAERQFTATTRYLHLPIKNGAPRRVVTLLVDGQPAVRNDIELADGKPDWWAPMEVGFWRGKPLTLRVDKLHEDSAALTSIEQSDTLKDAADLYREPLRGQFHFSPRRGWNNDPNGCVFYNGEYHLFFQHNPYGWAWGNMHWGHAVSKDLVHWEELGDKLLPDDMGPMFSGGAVVDWKNTSGFGKDGKAPMVLFYTAAGNPTVQGIAYSTDGRTFTKYSGNPVLKQITGGNRDPKVIWHEPTQKWVMVLYVELGGVHTIHFFTSPNLKDWTFASKTDGFFECPDFFELPVDGDASRRKWVLLGASSEYRVGIFDGQKFISESPKVPGHRGKGFYAAQSFSDVPEGRRLFIGWFQTETKGMPFNQSMTVPLELRLTQADDGPRLTFTPAKELEVLRAKSHRFDGTTLAPGNANPLSGVQGELLELRAEFAPGDASEVAFTVRGASIVYDAKKQELIVNKHKAPAPWHGGRQRLTIFCDRTGLEVFASDGLTYLPMPFQPKPDDLALSVEVRGGSARFESLQVHELKTAWTSR